MDTNSEANLDQLQKHQANEMQKCFQNISKWRKYREDYIELKKRLDNIADCLNYDIMVPLGSVAFVPGKLVHTNEILVLLGENLFVERSAKQASEIVGRRIENCDTQLTTLSQEQTLLENWAGVTNAISDQKELVNIIEDYDEEAEKKWRERRKNKAKFNGEQKSSSEDSLKYFGRLDELQIEEEINKIALANEITDTTIDDVATYDSSLESNENNSFSSLTEKEETLSTYQFTNPADIYAYHQSICKSKPPKSILKKSTSNEYSTSKEVVEAFTGTISQNKIADSKRVSFDSSLEEVKKTNLEDFDSFVCNAKNNAFSDVVVEHLECGNQNTLTTDKPKRVSLFKANQGMRY